LGVGVSKKGEVILIVLSCRFGWIVRGQASLVFPASEIPCASEKLSLSPYLPHQCSLFTLESLPR
jgi:hypothetical protein